MPTDVKKHFLLLALMLPLFSILHGQTGVPVSQMSSCDVLVNSFLSTHDIPGASLAIAKDGKLVYMRAFGDADLQGQEATQPHHLFRIASISKPITAIAIMQMVENQQLSLSDQVFGQGGILQNHPVLSTISVTDTRINNITVRHLLEHSAGWDRDSACTPAPTFPYPFPFTHCDPIGFPLHVTTVNGTPNPATEEDMIQFLMEKGLNFTPGTDYAYSNIGFLVLGEVIETISGMDYESYVKANVLAPLGICDMHLGKNLLADKMEREVEYEGNGGGIQSCYGTGNFVPWQYGGWNLEAMDAHGGWVATARDLVRLLVAVDGFPTKPDILAPGTITTMTTPSVNNPNYALGWQVNQFNNWWHTGALDGTATFFARIAHGYTWAVLLNKRVIGANAQAFWTDFDALPWNCIGGATGFPSFDLLEAPTTNSSGIVFNAVGPDSVSLSWNNGDGDMRMLVCRVVGAVDHFPSDGTVYSASDTLGQGDNLGVSNYVVYAGSGNSTTVRGLFPGFMHHFRLFEFNQNANTGGHPLYMLCNSAQDSVLTPAAVGVSAALSGLRVYPNPTADAVHIDFDGAPVAGRYVLADLSGRVLVRGDLGAERNVVDTGGLAAGLYLLTVESAEGKKVVKLRINQ